MTSREAETSTMPNSHGRLRQVPVDAVTRNVIFESGAFDGVHLIPVNRYREMAARLESLP
jgi:hypothetical protein